MHSFISTWVESLLRLTFTLMTIFNKLNETMDTLSDEDEEEEKDLVNGENVFQNSFLMFNLCLLNKDQF